MNDEKRLELKREVEAITDGAEAGAAELALLAENGTIVAEWRCGTGRTDKARGREVKCMQPLGRAIVTTKGILWENIFEDALGKRRTHLWLAPSAEDPWALFLGDRSSLRCPRHGIAWITRDEINAAVRAPHPRANRRHVQLAHCQPGDAKTLRGAIRGENDWPVMTQITGVAGGRLDASGDSHDVE